MSMLRIRPEAVTGSEPTTMISPWLVLRAVVERGHLRFWTIWAFHHFYAFLLNGVQPSIGPEIQKSSRLLRWRIRGISLWIHNYLIDSQHRHILAPPQKPLLLS